LEVAVRDLQLHGGHAGVEDDQRLLAHLSGLCGLAAEVILQLFARSGGVMMMMVVVGGGGGDGDGGGGHGPSYTKTNDTVFIWH
jgi:hypothetical protein